MVTRLTGRAGRTNRSDIYPNRSDTYPNRSDIYANRSDIYPNRSDIYANNLVIYANRSLPEFQHLLSACVPMDTRLLPAGRGIKAHFYH